MEIDPAQFKQEVAAPAASDIALEIVVGVAAAVQGKERDDPGGAVYQFNAVLRNQQVGWVAGAGVVVHRRQIRAGRLMRQVVDTCESGAELDWVLTTILFDLARLLANHSVDLARDATLTQWSDAEPAILRRVFRNIGKLEWITWASTRIQAGDSEIRAGFKAGHERHYRVGTTGLPCRFLEQMNRDAAVDLSKHTGAWLIGPPFARGAALNADCETAFGRDKLVLEVLLEFAMFGVVKACAVDKAFVRIAIRHIPRERRNRHQKRHQAEQSFHHGGQQAFFTGNRGLLCACRSPNQLAQHVARVS